MLVDGIMVTWELPAGVNLTEKWVMHSCDCTPEAYCKYFNPWPNTTRYEPCVRSPIDTIHGGGGAILSTGALKKIVPDRMLDCAQGGNGGPGNCAGTCSVRQGSRALGRLFVLQTAELCRMTVQAATAT